MPLHLDIVTPEKRVLSQDVEMVTVPGTDGELGILAAHVPLVTTLKPGELAYVHGGKTDYFAVGTGFVEVTGDHVTVLTDMAMGESEIDEKSVEDALRRAQERLENIKHDSASEEMAMVQAAIQKSMAQLHLKRRRTSI